MDLPLRGEACSSGGGEAVSERRVLVLADGPHELGSPRDWGRSLDQAALPALPVLVHRMAGEPSGVRYVCGKFGDEARIHGRSLPQTVADYASSKCRKNATGAVVKAWEDGFAAVVVVIDRDRKSPTCTILPIKAGRDAAVQIIGLPCAVGCAIEAFDAWMIADGKAIGAAGGDASISHPEPEKLKEKEGTGQHPKYRAMRIFGGGQGLGAKYAQVASAVDIDLLKTACPDGFAPFAKEVEERLLPVVGSNT
jgi:hypothetical protein